MNQHYSKALNIDRTFLNHMHPFLTRQQLDYGIYVVNQVHKLQLHAAFSGFMDNGHHKNKQ